MIRTVDDTTLVAALRDGDESAFAHLVDTHTPAMLRVARGYVPSNEIAEEVVQETWIALLKGIDKFEGRSSLRTWLFTVMINIAKARGVRERRDSDAAVTAFTGGTVDPARFRAATTRIPAIGCPPKCRHPSPTPPKARCWETSWSMSRAANSTSCPNANASSSRCATCSDRLT